MANQPKKLSDEQFLAELEGGGPAPVVPMQKLGDDDFSKMLDSSKTEYDANRDRTWGEAGKDTLLQLGEGGVNILGAIPNLVMPNSDLAQMANDGAKFLREKQSPPMLGMMKKADENIKKSADDGVLSEFVSALKENTKNPALFSRLITTNLPSIIPGLAAAKGAQAVSLARGINAGNAAKVGLAASGTTNSVLNGGSARGQSYEELYDILIKQGMNPNDAENVAMRESLFAGGIGLATGAISGTTGLEKFFVNGAKKKTTDGLVKKFAKGFAADAAGEQLEEVAPAIGGNLMANKHDPNHGILDGVGRTAAETFLASAPMGAATGVLSLKNNQPDQAQTLQQQQKAAEDISNILAAAQQNAGLSNPTDGKLGAENQSSPMAAATEDQLNPQIQSVQTESGQVDPAMLDGQIPEIADLSIPTDLPAGIEYLSEEVGLLRAGDVAKQGGVSFDTKLEAASIAKGIGSDWKPVRAKGGGFVVRYKPMSVEAKAALSSRANKKLQPSENDSMMAAIAKMGGVDKQSLLAFIGGGERDYSKVRSGILPVVRANGGLSVPDLVTRLAEAGYLSDGQGNNVESDFLERFDAAIAGRDSFKLNSTVLEDQAEEKAADGYQEWVGSGRYNPDVITTETTRERYTSLPADQQKHIAELLDETYGVSLNNLLLFSEENGKVTKEDAVRMAIETHVKPELLAQFNTLSEETQDAILYELASNAGDLGIDVLIDFGKDAEADGSFLTHPTQRKGVEEIQDIPFNEKKVEDDNTPEFDDLDEYEQQLIAEELDEELSQQQTAAELTKSERDELNKQIAPRNNGRKIGQAPSTFASRGPREGEESDVRYPGADAREIKASQEVGGQILAPKSGGQVLSENAYFAEQGKKLDVGYVATSSEVKPLSERVKSALEDAGYEVALQHSGSAFGKSSYIGATHPVTGRRLAPIRVSDHPKTGRDVGHHWNIFNDEGISQVVEYAEYLNGEGITSHKKQLNEQYDAVQNGVRRKHSARLERVIEKSRVGESLSNSERSALQYAEKLKAKGEELTDIEAEPILVVDGIKRSSINSERRLISSTADRIKKFWKWFNESAVTDVDGKPLVVYHGTNADFSEFKPSKTLGDMYFSSESKSYANAMTSENGGNVMPMYVAISNPYIIPHSEYNIDALETAYSSEHDGLIAVDSDGVKQVIVAFDSRQLKSATGNNGEFNSEDPSILFSKNKANEGEADFQTQTNSNGKPIHSATGAIKKFLNWFGGSAVVDGNGDPLLMYHGTSQDGDFVKFKVGARGAWFTSDPEAASEYAEDNDSTGARYNPDTRNYEKFNTASRVIPVYLKIENPYRLSNEEKQRVNVENYAKAQRELFAEIRAKGHDGVLWSDNLNKEWVVLGGSNQIKSATGNNGEFDINTPNILFSKKAIEERDDAYSAAIERGDLQAAQKLVYEAAAEDGYIESNSHRMQHRAPNSDDDVRLSDLRESELVPADYWTKPRMYLTDQREFISHRMITNLFRDMDGIKSTGGDPSSALITVYRAIPKNVKDSKIRNGDWVTPYEGYARDEGQLINGGYRVISQEVEAGHLYWDGNSSAEFGYDDGVEYGYKNTKNNRKRLDVITRDDEGNVIPLSKRFNSRNADARFSKAKEDFRAKASSVSHGKRLTGIKKKDIEAEFGDELLGLPIDVYQNFSDIPEAIRKRMGALHPTAEELANETSEESAAREESIFNLGGVVEAFYDPQYKRVTLIAANISSLERAKQVLTHEIVGHYGIENMLAPNELEAIENRVIKAINDGHSVFKKYSDLVERDQPNLMPHAHAKEVIAKMAEAGEHNSVAKRFTDVIRRVLSKIRLIKDDVTDAEIRKILRDSRKYVESTRDNFLNKTKPTDKIQAKDLIQYKRAADGTFRWRFGEKAYAHLGFAVRKHLSGDTVTFGGHFSLTDNQPKVFKQMMRKFRADVQMAQDSAKNMATAGKDLTQEQRDMISAIVEKTLPSGEIPPDHIAKLATDIIASYDTLAKEMIDLGMLSNERVAKNYMSRYYMGKGLLSIKSKADIKAAFNVAKLKIKGNNLKHRGIFETVPIDSLSEFEALGWKLSGMEDGTKIPDNLQTALDKRKDEKASSQEKASALSEKGIARSKKNAIQFTDLPAEFEGARSQLRVTVWRDYTESERERMGEVRDGIMRFALSYIELRKDIAIGRLFKSIADNSDLSSNIQLSGWKAVPNEEIAHSGGVKKYGALAGKFVPPDVMDALKISTQPVNNRLVKGYLKALSWWKEGKTVWNPVAHSNNVVSNIITAQWAGINVLDPKVWKGAFVELKNQGDLFKEAQEEGLFGTNFVSAEIADILMPKMDDFADMDTLVASRVEGFARSGLNIIPKLLGGYREKMAKAYEAEDKLFKMMLYIDRRKAGLSPQEAIDNAEMYIFNYADIPSGARVIKNTALPFFSYVYKAIPMLANTAMTRPHALLATWGVFWTLNKLGVIISGADEDDERENMPEYMKGNTALGTPKALRMPWSIDGDAVYMDVMRRMPLGDIFDLENQNNGMDWIPAPLIPSHPLLAMYTGLILNKDSFLGAELVKESDSDEEAMRKRISFMWQNLTPNAPIIPGSFNFNKLMDGLAYTFDTDLLGYTGYTQGGKSRPLEFMAADVFMGMKFRTMNPDDQRGFAERDTNYEIKSLLIEQRKMDRKQNITEDRRQEKKEELAAKIKRLQEKEGD